jgi:hypothetical protein
MVTHPVSSTAGCAEPSARLRESVSALQDELPTERVRAAVGDSLVRAGESIGSEITIVVACGGESDPERLEAAVLVVQLLEAAEETDGWVHGLGGRIRGSQPPSDHPPTAALAGAWLRARSAELVNSLGRDASHRHSLTQARIAEGWMREAEDLYDAGRTRDRYQDAAEGTRGSLGELGAALGGLAADQDAAQVQQLADFGGKLAMADKIRRDADALRARPAGDSPPAGEPLARGVYGLPVVLALEASPELASLLGGAIPPDRLGKVLDAIATAGGLSGAEEQADELQAQALASVEGIDYAADLKAWVEAELR